jgi:hypothetical protein
MIEMLTPSTAATVAELATTLIALVLALKLANVAIRRWKNRPNRNDETLP